MLNFLSYCLQRWFFSPMFSLRGREGPVCVLSCFFKSQFCWNALSHLEHVNGFSPVFILSCTFNLAVLIKALLQMKQANGFTNMGLFMNNDWLFQLQKNYKVGIGIVVLVLGIEYWVLRFFPVLVLVLVLVLRFTNCEVLVLVLVLPKWVFWYWYWYWGWKFWYCLCLLLWQGIASGKQ